MRPVRRSSEAPEVVPDSRLQTPDKYYIPPSFASAEQPFFPPGILGIAEQQKKDSDRRRENYFQGGRIHDGEDGNVVVNNFPPHPACSPVYDTPPRTRTGYDPVPYGIKTSDGPAGRAFKVLPTIILLAIAFLIGGGIGGGVGGALIVKEKGKVTAYVFHIPLLLYPSTSLIVSLRELVYKNNSTP